jgi:molecular chaperone DnaK (HSP70)
MKAQKELANEPKDVVIGIDLGTTNCCVAVWKGDKVEIIPNDRGIKTTPSFVGFDQNTAKRTVGQVGAVTSHARFYQLSNRFLHLSFVFAPKHSLTRQSFLFVCSPLQAAKSLAAQNPLNTLYDVKRIIGSEFDESINRHFPYGVVKGPDNKPMIETNATMHGKKSFAPGKIGCRSLTRIPTYACTRIPNT